MEEVNKPAPVVEQEEENASKTADTLTLAGNIIFFIDAACGFVMLFCLMVGSIEPVVGIPLGISVPLTGWTIKVLFHSIASIDESLFRLRKK